MTMSAVGAWERVAQLMEVLGPNVIEIHKLWGCRKYVWQKRNFVGFPFNKNKSIHFINKPTNIV